MLAHQRQNHQEWKVKQLRKQRNRCHYCECVMDTRKYDTREKFTVLPPNACTVDHVFPKSLGGTLRARNKVLCCLECNQEKGQKQNLLELIG